MKNRNYLIFGALTAFVLLIIFSRLTTANSIVPISFYSMGGNFGAQVFGLFAFYILAFSDINQVSSFRLTKYKLRWLIDMSIYMGLCSIFCVMTTAWFSKGWVGADGTLKTERWISFLGNFTLKINQQLNLIEAADSMNIANLTPIIAIAAGLGIWFAMMLHSLLLSFSFYVISFFVKDRSGCDSIKPGKRTSVVTISFIYIITSVLILNIFLQVTMFDLSILVFFNKYVLLFLFGVLLFYYFQPGSSLSMLIKNLFCDCDEAADSIKGQLQAIIKAKRIIMCLCFIALMFIPTAIFGGLTFHTADSFGIFRLLQNATILMFWGFLLIVMLTALEGKYNYKLFHQNGSLITDNMFLPKFVALPVILYLLMIVILFILFNVLF